jgi:hypothetical protein
LFIIDFLNAEKVIRTLPEQTVKSKGGIDFSISKEFKGGHIFNEIRFVDQGKSYHFTERVQALTKADFNTLLSENGFEILRTFGNFDLDPFDEMESDRLILIAKKR